MAVALYNSLRDKHKCTIIAKVSEHKNSNEIAETLVSLLGDVIVYNEFKLSNQGYVALESDLNTKEEKESLLMNWSNS